MTTSLSLLNALKDYGAKEIFGLPGDFILPFFKVIEDSEILPLYTLSHEPGIGFAADAAGRVHGNIGVAAITYGAGAFNLLNAVATAYAEKSPLVIISGAPGVKESEKGLLLHHQTKRIDSQFEIFKEVTCDQVKLNDPKTAPLLIARAIQNCIKKSRPVYIELPRDQVFVEAEKTLVELTNNYDVDKLDACSEDFIKSFNNSKNPVLMVGVEINRYGLEEKCLKLAKKFNIPVVTSFMGTGLLSENSDQLHGTYMGVAGDDKVTNLVENSDCLIMLGVILSDTNFGAAKNTITTNNIIHIEDGQVSVAYRKYDDVTITNLIDSLLVKLEDKKDMELKKDFTYPKNLILNDEKIIPLSIATAVNDFMDKHGKMPIASDIGDCLFTALDMQNSGLVAPGYYATMGFGVPAGIGVQIATKKRPIIVVGDGAFQMTGWELGNCSRYDLNPIVIVFNNSSWEMLRTFQPESKFNDLGYWAFSELANNLGGRGIKVHTNKELAQALEDVKDETKFSLIEVILEKGILSNTLDKFANGVKKLH